MKKYSRNTQKTLARSEYEFEYGSKMAEIAESNQKMVNQKSTRKSGLRLIEHWLDYTIRHYINPYIDFVEDDGERSLLRAKARREAFFMLLKEWHEGRFEMDWVF